MAAIAALALTMVAFIFYTKSSSSSDAVVVRSIAVLPFVNASADANTEYISDGITEHLINNLSQFPQLQVIARSTAFRYKGREVDPKAVGRELGVRAVLMGRVLQLNDVLNIQTELVDAEKGTQIWGTQYNYKLSDIFSLQEKISREISKSLKLKLTGEDEKRLGKRYTENTEAYQLYLKGRYFWNKRTGADIRKGIDYFEQAIAKDPNYALAYAGLAYSYLVLPGYTDISSLSVDQKVKEAATTALSLDDSLAEAHAALANAAWRFEWDVSGAERGYKRAIELNPNYATAYQWYALFLSDLRRHDEAIAEMKRALKNDPLSLSINNGMGRIFAEAREYDLAIAQLRKTLEIDQSFNRPHRYLGEVYVQKGTLDMAIAEFQQSIDASDNYMGLAGLAHAYAVSNRKDEAQKIIEDLQGKQNHNESLSYQLAIIYAGQGENERSLEELQKAYESRSPWLIHLNVEPRFDKLRDDPKFIDLLTRVGFVK
ncbi:MAG: tetratricopeptide repeat protein [Pyrinomonadaceae bacterium]